MKNKIKTIILFFTIFLLFASYGSVGIQTQNGDIDDFSTLTFTYSFEQPLFSMVNEQEDIESITIQDLPEMHQQGKPVLPVKPIQVLLPYQTTMKDITIEILSEPIIYQNVCLEHAPSLFTIQQQINDIIDSEISEQSCVSDQLIHSINQQRFRGFTLLFITISPVIYDSEDRQLLFYPELSIQITTDSTATPQYPMPVYPLDKQRVLSQVENPSYIDTYPTDEYQTTSSDIKYIIITNEALANSGLEDNFQTLLYAKNEKGVTADLFTVEDIVSNSAYSVNGTWGDNNPSNPFYQHAITKNYHLFDDDAARIRNFIRYAYMELGTEYVLLGGDGDIGVHDQNIIPPRGLFANESGLPLIETPQLNDEEEDDLPSDIYYACLDGNFNQDMDLHFGESPDRNDVEEKDEADLIAEVYVGRACVDSEKELAYFVSKTLAYERSRHPYLSKILFVGEYLGFPGISAYGGNYKDLIKTLIPDDYNLETLYDRDLPYEWSKYDIMEIINNATPHIINHDGHSYYGYNLKMHNSDVDYLTNTNTFFLYSHGCMAGGFDNPSGYDCIAERLTVETPFGAFAAIMNSRYGLGSENTLESPSMFLDESFFKALYIEEIREIGRANHYSKEDHIWRINDNGIRWVFYETNLFGDPELSIKTPNQEPVELNMEIITPEQNSRLYLRNTPLFTLPFINYPVILGSLTVEATAESEPAGNVYAVEFLLNNQTFHVDTKQPYTWTIDKEMKGHYELSFIAKGYYGETLRKDMSVYIWIR